MFCFIYVLHRIPCTTGNKVLVSQTFLTLALELHHFEILSDKGSNVTFRNYKFMLKKIHPNNIIILSAFII